MELKNKKIHSDYEKLQSLQNVQNELENEYFFPTQERKIVVAVFNKGFT